MYYDPKKQAYTIIGTVMGFGYDCKRDKIDKFERRKQEMWNKVSYWVGWIKEKLAEYDEPICSADKEDDNKVQGDEENNIFYLTTYFKLI